MWHITMHCSIVTNKVYNEFIIAFRLLVTAVSVIHSHSSWGSPHTSRNPVSINKAAFSFTPGLFVLDLIIHWFIFTQAAVIYSPHISCLLLSISSILQPTLKSFCGGWEVSTAKHRFSAALLLLFLATYTSSPSLVVLGVQHSKQWST